MTRHPAAIHYHLDLALLAKKHLFQIDCSFIFEL